MFMLGLPCAQDLPLQVKAASLYFMLNATSNQYHFTTAATPTVIHYCIVDGAVPSFKLRGYIPDGNRDGFATSEYAPNFWRNLRGE
jgi:hypothetical protein